MTANTIPVWQKKGIVLRPDQDFELSHSANAIGNIQNFTSPAIPLGNDHWRIWYSAYPDSDHRRFNIAYAEGSPDGKMQKFQACLDSGVAPKTMFSISNLPENWRPIQPVLINIPGKGYKLYFWAHAPGIVRYLCAESEDGHNFVVVNAGNPCLYHPNDRAVEKKISGTEGLTSVSKTVRPANEPPAPEYLISNDATNVYLLPDNTFEMFTVQLVRISADSAAHVPHDNLMGMIRVIERRTSTDGLNWSPPETVIRPDGKDPADLQFYYLSVTHCDGFRIGILGHYRAMAQTMDFEFCFSKDGVNWERPYRKPCFPRSVELDGLYGIYAPHSIVKHGSLYYLFYTGTNQTHNKKCHRGTPEVNIRLAVTEKLL